MRKHTYRRSAEGCSSLPWLWSPSQCHTRRFRTCRLRCSRGGGSSGRKHRHSKQLKIEEKLVSIEREKDGEFEGRGVRKRDREITSYDVAEMRDVVDVGQGAGDQDVSLARDWKLRSLLFISHLFLFLFFVYF